MQDQSFDVIRELSLEADRKETAESQELEPRMAFSWVFLYCLVCLVLTAAVFGMRVKAIYDWTGQDQSRHSPWTTFLVVLIPVIAILLTCLIPFLQIASYRERNQRIFGIQSILIGTAAVAVMFAAVRLSPQGASIALCVAAYSYAVWLAFRYREQRLAIATFLLCVNLPYAWILTKYQHFDFPFYFLIWIGTLPAFFPTLFFYQFFEGNIHSESHLPLVTTAIEVSAGAWAIRFGPRRALTCILWATILAMFGSLVFHAMYRA